jgi:hypothetical protein
LLSLLPLSLSHVAPTHMHVHFFLSVRTLSFRTWSIKYFLSFFFPLPRPFSDYNFCFLGAHARAEVLPTPRPNFCLRYFFVCDGYTHAHTHTHSYTPRPNFRLRYVQGLCVRCVCAPHLCVRIFPRVCVYAIRTHTHTHTHTHTQTHTHTHTPVCVYTFTQSCAFTHTHTDAYTTCGKGGEP